MWIRIIDRWDCLIEEVRFQEWENFSDGNGGGSMVKLREMGIGKELCSGWWTLKNVVVEFFYELLECLRNIRYSRKRDESLYDQYWS